MTTNEMIKELFQDFPLIITPFLTSLGSRHKVRQTLKEFIEVGGSGGTLEKGESYMYIYDHHNAMLHQEEEEEET